jgi:hemoglobin-like flavoprotein
MLRQAGWAGAIPCCYCSTMHVLVVLTHLCDNVPGGKEAFTSTAAYEKQVLMVLQTVDDIVRALDELESIIPFLRGLGARYAQHGIQAEHVDIFEKAFFAMLKDAIGPSVWDETTHSAWWDSAQAVKNIMVPALVQAHKEANLIKMVGWWCSNTTYRVYVCVCVCVLCSAVHTFIHT